MKIRLAMGMALCFWTLTASAQTAGVLIKATDTRNGTSIKMEIRVVKDHVRIDGTWAGVAMATIFDNTKSMSFQIDLKAGTYTEMSPPEMQRMIAESIKQMIPNPTPDQQKRLDETLAALKGGVPGPLPTPEYFPFSTGKVGEWPCKNYASLGGAVVCAADPALFGLSASDLDALRQYQDFEVTLVSRPPGVSPSPPWEFFLSGVAEGKPLAVLVLRRTVESIPGNRAVFEVNEVRGETFAPNLFEVPAGLRRETMPAPVVPLPPRAR